MKEKNVVDYYVLFNKLKNIVRTGWTDWHVKRERVESIAEHIYGVQMLAMIINSEYKYDIDIMKVMFMLAIHEIGEIKIGDLTMFQISKEEKIKIERKAVSDILANLMDKDMIEALFLEFDERKTKEAQFAHMCDKLECDLQCRIYDEEGCVDLNHQEDNKSFYHSDVQDLFNQGLSWSEIWLKFWQQKAGYDDNFMRISKYAESNKIINDNYKIIKADYQKYIELNGLLQSDKPLVLAIKDNKADYYYIEKNNKIIEDFAIYKDNNLLTLDINKFNDKQFIDIIFQEIKKDYNSIIIYIPIEMIELVEIIKNNYKCTCENVCQKEYEYMKITLVLL